MNRNLPLDQLIPTLLALAEAMPNLPPEALRYMSSLGDNLQKKLKALDPTDEEALVKVLSRTGRRLFVRLYLTQAAFKEVKTAWDQQLTSRPRLELDEWGKISNPGPEISPCLVRDIPPSPPAPAPSPLQCLANILLEALRNPQSFAQNNQTLQSLASLVGLRWPR